MKVGINPVPEQADALIKEAGWKFIVCYQAGAEPNPMLDIVVYGFTVVGAFYNLTKEMEFRNRLWKQQALQMAVDEGKPPMASYEY